jgi:uncharacterized protein
MGCKVCFTCERGYAPLAFRGEQKFPQVPQGQVQQSGECPFFRPNNVTIFITDKCNLACDYCFIRKGNREMDLDTLKQSIDFILDKGINSIWYFGGEPLLEMDLIKKADDYLFSRRKISGINLMIGMTTNGILLTEENVKWLLTRRYGLLISLDGTKEKHDKHRVFPDGRGSWDIVWKNLKFIRQFYDPQIRWTVAPDTVKGLADDIIWFVNHGFNNLAIEWVYEVSWDDVLDILSDELRKLRVFKPVWEWRTNIKTLRDAGEVSYSIADSWKNRCGLGTTGFAIDPDLNIYPCHRYVTETPELTIGKVPEIDMEKVRKLHEEWIKEKPHPIDKERCETCYFRDSCNGGCLAMNYRLHKDMHIVPKSVCDIRERIGEAFGVLAMRRAMQQPQRPMPM